MFKIEESHRSEFAPISRLFICRFLYKCIQYLLSCYCQQASDHLSTYASNIVPVNLFGNVIILTVVPYLILKLLSFVPTAFFLLKIAGDGLRSRTLTIFKCFHKLHNDETIRRMLSSLAPEGHVKYTL